MSGLRSSAELFSNSGGELLILGQDNEAFIVSIMLVVF